jgi:hypothetical protein
MPPLSEEEWVRSHPISLLARIPPEIDSAIWRGSDASERSRLEPYPDDNTRACLCCGARMPDRSRAADEWIAALLARLARRGAVARRIRGSLVAWLLGDDALDSRRPAVAIPRLDCAGRELPAPLVDAYAPARRGSLWMSRYCPTADRSRDAHLLGAETGRQRFLLCGAAARAGAIADRVPFSEPTRSGYPSW